MFCQIMKMNTNVHNNASWGTQNSPSPYTVIRISMTRTRISSKWIQVMDTLLS